jgi:predicted Zn-dependent protease
MRTHNEIKQILDSVMSKLSGVEAQASYRSDYSLATRFGENSITQNMGGEIENLRLKVYKGKRSGSYETNRFDDESLNRLVKIASAMAEDSPEDPEYLPLPGPQEYLDIPCGWSDDVVNLAPDVIAGDIAKVVSAAKVKGFKASGLFEARAAVNAIANTNGLFAFDNSTDITYSTTVHGPAGSGKAEISRNSYADMDVEKLLNTAVENSVMAQNPVDIEPGDYTVIFEPAAMLEFFAFMVWNMDARDADEGTTVFAGKVGEKMFSDKVTVTLKTDCKELPAPKFGDSGIAVKPRTWIEKGILKKLEHSRFWAEKKGEQPDPALYPFFMEGEDNSVEDLVKKCKRGLLVKNLWYIRYVDRRELLLTGMTRDGLFLIEDGKIVSPVKNLRWNESPIVFLNNIVAMSRPERVLQYAMLPGVMSEGFTFSSKTESV